MSAGSSAPAPPVRADVARALVEASLLRGDFVLRSGQRSSYYFDKYRFETRPDLLRPIARLLADMLPEGVDRLAGPELGAVALATAVSLESGLPFVIVRKGEKDHGASAGKPFEGVLEAGERVVIVEDVLTTGGEALRSGRLLRDLGVEVVEILVVVDRGQDGLRNLAAEGFRGRALFGPADLGLA